MKKIFIILEKKKIVQRIRSRIERPLIVFLYIICCFTSASSQDTLSVESFVIPIDHKIKISGSFGELRPNHFHAGIDFKSKNGSEGDTIRASASGFISRIKVQSGGYGQVIYIDHPNGYTTVYAHLQKFNPAIEAFIHQKQYNIKSYEIDVYPEQNRFQLEQGQFIGLMGNTGRSYGPHLHFEIRNTETEHPINPYILGIGPKDTKPPSIYSIGIHGLDNDHHSVWSKSYTWNKKSSPSYEIPAWRVGMSIQTFDLMDGSTNKNGIYSIEMLVDDTLYYKHVMDEFNF